MVDQNIIIAEMRPTEWVSSITYPQKPNGSLCVCLDSWDLNKAMVSKYYEAPTLIQMSQKLSGANIFSKSDSRDGFWSIHKDESVYLSLCLIPTKAATDPDICPLVLKWVQISSSWWWTGWQGGFLASLLSMMTWIFGKTPRSMMGILLV